MKLRIFNILLIFLAGAALMIGSALAEGDSGGNKNTGLRKPDGQPIRAYLNINNISTVIKNTGISDIDVGEANSGLVFPKGSGKTAVFMSGLVWGAFIEGDPQVRVGGSTYNEGLQGGAILDNGTVESNTEDHVRIYRVRPNVYPGGPDVELTTEATIEAMSEDAVRLQYETDWTEWPATSGAPYTDVDESGTYDPNVDIPGVPGADQTIWYVCNDQENQLTSQLYGTLPLGMEMQLTVWAYAQTGALGNMFFRKYKIINETATLGQNGGLGYSFDDMYVSMWSDIDIGNSTDDFAGSDTVLSLSYAFNGLANDPTYNPLPPPAVGFDYFQGPLLDGVAGEDFNNNGVDDANDYAIFNNMVVGPGKINMPMTAAYYFVRGDPAVTDPVLGSIEGSTQFYNFMQGRIGLTGEFFTNPVTGLPTTFTLPGDPVTGEGWIDGQLIGPNDRRIGMASGPFTMEPGDTQEVVVAEICAGAIEGVDRLSAVSLLKYYDQIAQVAYDNFFDLPVAPPAPFVAVWDGGTLRSGATELDGEIVLDWSKDNDRVLATETFDEKGYAFQGYNVYQLPNAAANVTEGIRIATYDIRDGVGKINDLVFDIGTGSVVTLPTQFGNDTGIKRFISITNDAINQRPLINGIRYYFAVTAYNYNDDPTAVPNNLENPINIITVTPQGSNPGVTIGENTNEGLELTHVGTADGIVTAVVVDPYSVTGDNYEISFFTQAQIRDADRNWVQSAQVTRKYNPNSPDTLTGTTIDIAPVYGGIYPNSVDLNFHLEVVHHYYGWADGVTLTFPPGTQILNVPDILVSGSQGDPEPVVITDNVVQIGITDNSQTQGGHFHDGGEDWVITVPVYDTMYVDWEVHDDGYAGGQNELGTTVVSNVIGNASRVADLWRVTNTSTSTVVLDNQSIYAGTDMWPPTDFAITDLGPDAHPIIEGFQVSVDVGFAAPTTLSQANPPLLNGEDVFTWSSGSVWYDSDNYTICDFTRFGYADGTASTTWPLYGGVGGTLDVNELQKDYEFRFTGVLADTVIGGNTLEITQSGGSIATIFGASGYSIADHPLNPTPGVANPFTVRIPFELWSVDDDMQINVAFWDRSGDPTVDGGKVWNIDNRVYAWAILTPYSTDVIDITDAQYQNTATWNWALYNAQFTTGDVLTVFYDNPIQYDTDVWSFSTTQASYSSGLAKTQIGDINVFPNPYYGVNSEELNKYQRFVTFTHLPERANIKIFNLAGVLVRSIEKDDDGQYQRWGLVNDEGLPVASGLYIAYIELPDLGETTILKVAVIQEQQILDRF